MQKLLRRSPSAPILSAAGNTPVPSFLSIGFNSNNATFLSLGFKAKFKGHTKSFLTYILSPMPAATTLNLRPSSGIAATALAKNPASGCMVSRLLPTRCCRICRCAIDNRDSVRAWVVLKERESRSGSRTVWFHTAASDKGFQVAAVAEKYSGNLESGYENGVAEKPMRLHRRQKGGTSVGEALSRNPDLLTIPGVGPRNLRKLVENGIAGVAELKQLYKDKFFGKSSQKMVEFLQSSVGIIHRNHAESITTFIKESVDEELKEDSSNSDLQQIPKKRLTFCVEGNISVGKTTFLQRIANETLELQDLVEIVPEPINKWQDVGPDHFNILDAFYAEPQRYAYTFQNYVFVTRVMQERESSGGLKPLRLMERSVFSDRMVFVRAVHEANWMNEMEISIYDSWFDPVVSCLPGLIPDGFIYLRASPDTCHKRMLLRKREQRKADKLPHNMDCSLHPEIRDRVFYLEGDHMHSSIQKVPALVLDCEPNIDFGKDIEAKREYARQVAEFFEFVKKKNEDDPADKFGEAAKSSQPQPRLLLPHKGGLWVPDGKHFPDSALKSLDFRRAMSFMPG
ncbi:P-loop containing nucleoside triphosphate hydrolases superfamily protein [Actinidia rufa]|uniref:P-loop containing nucleoside triphosphate hydrolases superfamily protein n=1 Tax=Actinidia rufa TaxID=165716 RepID=A0A7J0EFN1_9ERIC|nr:P-loop containing nucleoside triphosphate hydrolases superfamily protein [Actinidia rufa]